MYPNYPSPSGPRSVGPPPDKMSPLLQYLQLLGLFLTQGRVATGPHIGWEGSPACPWRLEVEMQERPLLPSRTSPAKTIPGLRRASAVCQAPRRSLSRLRQQVTDARRCRQTAALGLALVQLLSIFTHSVTDGDDFTDRSRLLRKQHTAPSEWALSWGTVSLRSDI